jgi:hypothetical protein
MYPAVGKNMALSRIEETMQKYMVNTHKNMHRFRLISRKDQRWEEKNYGQEFSVEIF